MTVAEEQEAYRIVLRREMEHGGSGRTGLQFIQNAKAETDAIWANNNKAVQDLKAQLGAVQTALANEQAKPPKEVIKEVEKIVEKIVEVEKPVIVEVEPPWLVKLRQAIKTFLNLK